MVVYAPIILTCKSFNFLAILPLIVKDEYFFGILGVHSFFLNELRHIIIIVYNTYYTVIYKLVFNMPFSNLCDFYVQIYCINITCIN